MNELELKLQGVMRQLADWRDGQVFLRWVLDECGVFQQGFPRDAAFSAWEAGRRAFGLEMLRLCVAARCTDVLFTPPPSPPEAGSLNPGSPDGGFPGEGSPAPGFWGEGSPVPSPAGERDKFQKNM